MAAVFDEELVLLFLLLGGLSGSSVFAGLGALVGDGPLGELDADAISAGLDHDGVFLYRADGAGDATDGGDFVAKLQAVAHSFNGLLLLVLRTDEQEIENGDHNNDHNNAAAAFQNKFLRSVFLEMLRYIIAKTTNKDKYFLFNFSAQKC